MSEVRHVVIVGGGISGLSSAWYLQQEALRLGLNLRYSVLEASSRWGGKLHTESVEREGDGSFLVEAGPDSFITQKPWAYQLAQDLGLADHFIGTNEELKKLYVLHRGKPIPLPEGIMMMVPTKFLPFALSPLVSLKGKIRMALDWLIPAKEGSEDETLAEFVRRRLGEEALDKIAEPLMSGIYNADADKQSILATFPRFRHIEKEHGSLIKGMLASRRQESQFVSSPKIPVFVSFKGGIQELVDALVPRLTGDLRLNCRLSTIEKMPSGTYRLCTEEGDAFQADAVVLTTPASISAKLLRPLNTSLAEQLAQIRYLSTGTISLGFRRADLKQTLEGFGLVIPKSEKRPINAITIASVKFSNRAPDDTLLLRVFFGGSRSPESMHYSDEELLTVVGEEIRQILGIEASPLFHRIFRWHEASPQYDLGHLERVAVIEAALPERLYLTGSAFRGVGIPDCVHQAQEIVTRLVKNISQAEKSQEKLML
jgi:protoporphyrinogen/coproporphyrinogen III oxidase